MLEVKICYSKLDQFTAKPASWQYHPKRARTASAGDAKCSRVRSTTEGKRLTRHCYWHLTDLGKPANQRHLILE
jgi:hypothetical protein